MTQIKSEKAKEYAESAAFSPGGISYTLTYGDAYDGFIAGYEAAETEAEERHAKELQELQNRAVEAHMWCCCYQLDGVCHREGQYESCYNECIYVRDFTQKLNE